MTLRRLRPRASDILAKVLALLLAGPTLVCADVDRFDVRVVDPEGKPIKGVKAQAFRLSRDEGMEEFGEAVEYGTSDEAGRMSLRFEGAGGGGPPFLTYFSDPGRGLAAIVELDVDAARAPATVRLAPARGVCFILLSRRFAIDSRLDKIDPTIGCDLLMGGRPLGVPDHYPSSSQFRILLPPGKYQLATIAYFSAKHPRLRPPPTGKATTRPVPINHGGAILPGITLGWESKLDFTVEPGTDDMRVLVDVSPTTRPSYRWP